jgi:hypothetical protein
MDSIASATQVIVAGAFITYLVGDIRIFWPSNSIIDQRAANNLLSQRAADNKLSRRTGERVGSQFPKIVASDVCIGKSFSTGRLFEVDRVLRWAWGYGLRQIQRARGTCSGALLDVEVDHGGRDIGMPGQGLHGPDIDPAFEQLGGTRAAVVSREGACR